MIEARSDDRFDGRRRTDLLNSPVSNSVFRFATVSGQSIHWFLKRNCSVTPSQLGWLYASLCRGVARYRYRLLAARRADSCCPLPGSSSPAVGIAFLLYARHATDGEKIALQGGRLVVELENGGHYERTEFLPHQVRVEPQDSDRSLIEVSGQGRSVKVGRYVRPELACGAGAGDSHGVARA